MRKTKYIAVFIILRNSFLYIHLIHDVIVCTWDWIKILNTFFPVNVAVGGVQNKKQTKDLQIIKSSIHPAFSNVLQFLFSNPVPVWEDQKCDTAF
jgi:hypothetical protein